MKELRLQTVAEAIDKSGDFSGAMPAEFWLGMTADKRACEEALRLVITMTKRQIRERLGLTVADARRSPDVVTRAQDRRRPR